MKLFLDLFHLDLCLFYCGLLLDMLEGKLAVLRFQIKIKEELEHMASSSEVLHSTSNYVENGLVSDASPTVDANFANATREKAKELSSDLKSITQLYNEYAVPFKLWEVLLSLSGCMCGCARV
jgi:nuclear pore complex protein Nup155